MHDTEEGVHFETRLSECINIWHLCGLDFHTQLGMRIFRFKLEFRFYSKNLCSFISDHFGVILLDFTYFFSGFSSLSNLFIKFNLIPVHSSAYNSSRVNRNTLSKKSSWTLLKVQIFQKCFILGHLKAYHRTQVDVFFILIPNL